ncbi:unnamed protein product [Closterium sp. NIES-65]|nr:unnamed protein product [Closterium sp. NIES-65]
MRPHSRCTVFPSRPRLPFLSLAPCLLLLLLPPRIPSASAFAPDAIRGLPGQPRGAPAFGQWAGYIPVGPAGRKRLFYWLTESVTAPLTKPLVLWLNGATPFCCLLVLRAHTSPLTFPARSPVRAVANVLFLDSPAGAGFSYSLAASDLATGDNQTAQDTVQFLRAFLRRHPRYNGRKLLLAGESYAGHYIPQLADALVAMEARAAGRARMRVGGVLLGNPFVHARVYHPLPPRYIIPCRPGISSPAAQVYHPLPPRYTIPCRPGIPSPAAQVYHPLPPRYTIPCRPGISSPAAQCGFSADTVRPGIACDAVMNAIATADSGIDPYDIYAPVCLSPAYRSLHRNTQRSLLSRLFSFSSPRPSAPHSTSPSATPSSPSSLHPASQARGAGGGLVGAIQGQSASVWGGEGESGEGGTGAVRGAEGAAGAMSGVDGEGEVEGAEDAGAASRACMDVWVQRYLQWAPVQRALHAMPAAAAAQPHHWVPCSASLQYARGDMEDSMLPVLHRLLAAQVPLWIMSGDTDSVVPFTGTRQWVAGLNLPLLAPLHPWTLPSTQVGGWVTRYKGVTFITVRGAGHQIPTGRPAAALTIFHHFLHGTTLHALPSF